MNISATCIEHDHLRRSHKAKPLWTACSADVRATLNLLNHQIYTIIIKLLLFYPRYVSCTCDSGYVLIKLKFEIQHPPPPGNTPSIWTFKKSWLFIFPSPGLKLVFTLIYNPQINFFAKLLGWVSGPQLPCPIWNMSGWSLATGKNTVTS